MGKYKVMQIKQDLQGQSDTCASESCSYCSLLGECSTAGVGRQGVAAC